MNPISMPGSRVAIPIRRFGVKKAAMFCRRWNSYRKDRCVQRSGQSARKGTYALPFQRPRVPSFYAVGLSRGEHLDHHSSPITPRPNRHSHLTVGFHPGPVHAARIERQDDIALAVDGDAAAAAVVVRHAVQRLGAGALQRPAAPGQARVNSMAEAAANERLAGAGAGYGGAAVVGESAGANHRRVADPSRQLVGETAGGRGGGQMALRIARHRADGAEGGIVVAEGVIVVIQGDRPGAPGGLQLVQPLGGDEEAGLHHLHAQFGGEVFGPGATEEHMRRAFHDGAGETDRAAHAADAGDGAAGAIGAVDDGGVQFRLAVAAQHRADAGVEQRAVLHQFDGAGHRVEGGSSGAQQGERFAGDAVQGGALFRLGAGAGRRIAGAAVQGEADQG